MKRDFKGIWIPKQIWLNKNLTVMEKLFLVEIDSLDNADGCFASNAHFADVFDVTKGRCTQIIRSLEAKKYVNIQLIREGKQVVRRLIRVVNKLNNPIKNIKQPYLENAQGNNTITNNTKRELRALDFLLKYSPELMEAFDRNHKKQITDYKKFSQDFNDKVDVEGMEYTVKKISARLNSYARNWIANNAKYKILHPETIKPNYLKNFSA